MPNILSPSAFVIAVVVAVALAFLFYEMLTKKKVEEKYKEPEEGDHILRVSWLIFGSVAVFDVATDFGVPQHPTDLFLALAVFTSLQTLVACDRNRRVKMIALVRRLLNEARDALTDDHPQISAWEDMEDLVGDIEFILDYGGAPSEGQVEELSELVRKLGGGIARIVPMPPPPEH